MKFQYIQGLEFILSNYIDFHVFQDVYEPCYLPSVVLLHLLLRRSDPAGRCIAPVSRRLGWGTEPLWGWSPPTSLQPTTAGTLPDWESGQTVGTIPAPSDSAPCAVTKK